ncbi:hypothetical protein BDR04DRAFT_1116396 [Suillus decipiens]|nr:hypothetical protein BDR04DRAFT_1116396 [Suillus decipiens]
MSAYLDVSSAYDWWKDGKRLNMLVQMENTWSLDMGFDRMPVNDISLEDGPLDMGFHSHLVQHEHPDQRPLDMGFGPDPIHNVPAQSLNSQPEEMSLDMGFATDPAQDLAHSLYIQLEDRLLDVGFEMNPVQVDPDQSRFEMLHLISCVGLVTA